MDLRWVKITPELKNGIEIINELDDSKYLKFLSHIKESSSDRLKSEIFTAEETVALERVFKMDSDRVAVIIKITSYLLDRMSKFVMQPSRLTEHLVDVLMFKEEKARAFVGVWQSLIRDTFQEFNIENLGRIDEITESNWQLNIGIGSHLNKKETLSTVLLNLKTSERTYLELAPDELVNFNTRLENAQFDMDNLLNTHMKSQK